MENYFTTKVIKIIYKLIINLYINKFFAQSIIMFVMYDRFELHIYIQVCTKFIILYLFI